MYKIKSFTLYSHCRWNEFSKAEELGKQLSFTLMYINLFFDKRNFMRTKSFPLEKKNKNNAKNNVGHAEHKSKVSKLAILKIIRTKHRKRPWLSLILYCIQTSLLKKSGKTKNKLRTINCKNQKRFKNSKPRVQFQWFF